MARSVSVFTSDQCEDLDFELDSQYEQLLPILEKAVAAHRANQDLPSLEDTVRAHVETAEKLAAPCRRFLRDLEKMTPPWREVKLSSYGPPLTPAELNERMSALDKSRLAVERLLEETRMWEKISRWRRRKPGKQTEGDWCWQNGSAYK